MRHPWDLDFGIFRESLSCLDLLLRPRDKMEFLELIRKRHSIRAYGRAPVEESKLSLIMEAISSAPSAGNLQAYEVYVVKGERKKRELAKAARDQDFIIGAPVCLVFFASPQRSSVRYGPRGEALYCVQDATIAATFAMLAAVNLGLCTVWLGAFDDEEVAKVCGVKSLRPVAILPIGYPAEEPEITSRRAVEDIFHHVA
jgi:nitroreductase